MASKQDILKEKEFLSDRISTQVRTVALGLLGITWGLLIGKSDAAVEIASSIGKHLMAIGGIAILTMFLDFLQYLFGYWYTDNLIKEMEKANEEEGKYRYSDLRYRLRTFMFCSKQISLIIGVMWLFVVLFIYLF
jgi:hypothetical protein